MPLDPTTLRQSFDLIIDRRPDLTIRFYEILFARYPALAPLFRRDRTAQAKMLADWKVAMEKKQAARASGDDPAAGDDGANDPDDDGEDNEIA